MAIPEEIIDEVRSRADILGVIGDYVSLKKRGRNWLGLCPFHGEKTPSFTVSPEKNMFYCFGCGVGGNVFSFLMRIENLTFIESVKKLAGNYGIAIPERPVSPATREKIDRKERISAALEEATKYYQNSLLKSPDGEDGREYLKARDYDINIAKSFRLGWAPKGWSNVLDHLKGKGYTELEIEGAGLAVKSDKGGYYDRFRERIIFPIMSVQDAVLGFGGRLIRDEENSPKYLNSSETAVYHKSDVLYGMHAAKNALRKNDAALVVEGYFDCIALHKHGFANAVATCGTAMTAQQVRILSRYTKNIFPLFDADEAGRKAIRRALEVILAAPARAFSISLPSGDPDSFLAEEGPEAMTHLIDKAPPLLETTIDEIIKRAAPGVEGRQEALKEVASLLAVMTDRQAMELYLRQTASKLIPGAGADSEQLFREEIARTRRISQRAAYSSAQRTEVKPRKAPTREMHLIALCMDQSEILDRFRENSELIDDFEDEQLKDIARALLDSPGVASVIDNMPPEFADVITGLIINSAEAMSGDTKRDPGAEFDEMARRIRKSKITRMIDDIQARLASAAPDEQIDLLRRKGELVEQERNLLEENLR